MVAPADVRRDRGGEVHQARKGGPERDELRQRIRAPDRSQRGRAPVEAESPGGRVSLRGDEVAPVFRHQPEPEERRGGRRQPRIDLVEGGAHGEHEEDARAELPLVHPGTENVDPWAQPVVVDSEHHYIIGITAAGASRNVAAFVTSLSVAPFR